MVRTILIALPFVLLVAEANAQSQALQAYLNSTVLKAAVEQVARKDPASRTDAEIRNLLPHQVSQSYVNYIRVNSARSMLDVIDALRLNKMLTSPPGTGGTSLVSRVAVPSPIRSSRPTSSSFPARTRTISRCATG